jgi:hypothetical protein
MKKTYSTPELTTHGNVEKMTQIFGNEGGSDTGTFNGQVVVRGRNSVNGIVVPVS